MSQGGMFRESIVATADVDLTSNQYHIMRYSGDHTIDISSGDASAHIGVLQDKPDSGQNGSVLVMGVSKVVAGASITAGKLITSNGSGRAIAATDGSQDVIIGRALEAASNDGEVFEALIFPAYRLVGADFG